MVCNGCGKRGAVVGQEEEGWVRRKRGGSGGREGMKCRKGRKGGKGKRYDLPKRKPARQRGRRDERRNRLEMDEETLNPD